MTEIDMGPSVAVALHGTPLPKDGFSMVYIGSAAPVTSKSLLNHGENYCGCLGNVACNDDSLVAPTGLPGTSRKFKEYGLQIDQRLVPSVSRHPDMCGGDESGGESVAQSHASVSMNEHDSNTQRRNLSASSQDVVGYTNSHEENASLYPNGRRKRVKATDLEEPSSPTNNPQSAVGTSAPLLDSCGIADPGPSEKSHLTEKTKWRNDVSQPEARRRRWAQADPLLDMWKAASASKYAAAFRRPVARLEEYDGIVRQRMDLSTIRRRLENGLSYSITELHRDLMLMLANAVVYNKQGSEMFQMALKLKDHITKLFKELSCMKPNEVSPPAEALIKSGANTSVFRAAKSKKQLPLPQDEFYNSGRSPSKQNGDMRKALGDLPIAPFKRQRTARKPRLFVGFDSVGFQLRNCAAMEMDSSSEEEVAAMLICIRSGQDFHVGQDKGAVQVSGYKLSGDHTSLLLARQPNLLNANSCQKGATANQFEQAPEAGDNGSKPSECSTAIHPTLPQSSISDLRAIEKRDIPTRSVTPGLSGTCKNTLLCPYAEMGTRNDHCQQRSSCKEVSESPNQEWMERSCEQSSWCMSEANVLASVGMEVQSRNVEASLLITSVPSSDEMIHTRSSFGANDLLCSDDSVLSSAKDERGLDMKIEHGTQVGDIKSEKNCMGLKHKWQQRWQMQSAAMSEGKTTTGAGKSVTRSRGHGEQAGPPFCI